MQRFRTSGLKVGEAKRVLLKPGDAIIAHQRLAHCAGYNLSDSIRKNVYFRVEHRRFQYFVEDYVNNETPWIGFTGLKHFLPLDAVQIPDSTDDGDEDDEVNAQCQNDDDSEAEQNHDEKRLDQIRRVLAAVGVSEKLSAEQRAKLQVTAAQKKQFIKDGYVVFPKLIRTEVLAKAIKKVEMAYNNGKYNVRDWYCDGKKRELLKFGRQARSSLMLTNVLLTTGVVDVLEEFLGKRNVVLCDNKADIIYIPGYDGCTVKGDGDGNGDVNDGESLASLDWDMDMAKGRFKEKGVDHVMRVVVALSDDLEEDKDNGQLVLWKGKQGVVDCQG